MSHSLFKIFDSFNLISPKNRLDRIVSLKPSDFTELANKLETALPKSRIPTAEHFRPFELYLPYPSSATLSRVPSYSFLFDKVYVLDPMYDYCSWLEMSEQEALGFYIEMIGKLANASPGKIIEVLGNDKPSVDQLTLEFVRQVKLASAKDLNKIITFYIQYRELIEERVFIPYVDTSTAYDDELCAHFTVLLGKEAIPTDLGDIDDAESRLRVAREIFLDQRRVASMKDIYRFFLTTSVFKSLFPASETTNIDFGGDKNKRMLDRAIQISANLIKDNVQSIDGIKWPKPEESLTVLSLVGVPPQDILSIREKEKPALENYRYKLQRKLIDLRSTAGSQEYVNLIRALQVEQKQQMAEVTLLAEHIKRDILRKISHQIGVITFSAAGAILSASVAIKDPIALLGVGIGGAGLSAGISKLVEMWMDYKSEMDALKEKDGYILWKLRGK